MSLPKVSDPVVVLRDLTCKGVAYYRGDSLVVDDAYLREILIRVADAREPHEGEILHKSAAAEIDEMLAKNGILTSGK